MGIAWTETTTGQFKTLPEQRYLVLWHYTSPADYIRATITKPSQVPSHLDIKIMQYAAFDLPASDVGLVYHSKPFDM